MLDQQETLLHPFSLFSLLLLAFFTKWFFFTKSNKNLPPSPSSFPILGNLHQLGMHPRRSLQSLAQRHGPAMLLHLGNAPTLVVSSADFARQIMRTHDIIFSNRPDASIQRKLLYDYKDLAMSRYGQYWRQMRSICVLHLLSAKRVESFQSVREEEVNLLVKKIEQSCSSSLPIDIGELFASLANDVTSKVALGKKYSEGDGGVKFKKLLLEFGALLGTFNVADFIPFLGWINYFTGLNARVDKLFKEFDQFLDEVLNDHMSPQREDMKDDQMDFVDVLLKLQKSCADGVPLGRDSLKAIILDMFAAGTDTTHTALEWTMTELLRHPEVMKQAQEEIRDIGGSKSNITEDDLVEMHYLKAVIKESLRLHPPVPLLLPRESTEDVKLQEYHIPAKTRVIMNAWAIGRDPLTWEEAEEFKPERFLDSPIDYKGHDFQFIPFGAGRRGCPGITFATAIIEIALANLLYRFNWSLPNGAKPEDLDASEAPGLVVHRKFPLLVVATPHSF